MSDKRRVKTASFLTVGAITTISIALVLFLLGLTFIVGFTAKGLNSYIQENLGLSIEVSGSTPATSIEKMKQDLLNNPYVFKVNYIPKEDVKKQLISDLGSDPQTVLGYDITPSYFDVYLKAKYINTDSINKVKQSLMSIRSLNEQKIINNVIYKDTDIANATSNLSLLGSVLSVLAIVLIIISFTLIRSIIQLNIYSKRFIINTMQLVGATNSFIRKPFVCKMVLCGIIAAVIADLCISGVLCYISSIFPMPIHILSMADISLVYIAVLVLGVFISIISTTFSVNRYLRMTSGNLYYI